MDSKMLQSTLEGWFKKLPALPSSAVDVLVMIAPWIALVFGVLGILGGLAGLGLMSAFAPFAVMGRVGGYGLAMVASVGWLISSVLMLVAFPGLKAGKLGGWNWLFWSEVVSVVASVVAISIGSVIGALIGFYLLFQIKPRYK